MKTIETVEVEPRKFKIKQEPWHENPDTWKTIAIVCFAVSAILMYTVVPLLLMDF